MKDKYIESLQKLKREGINNKQELEVWKSKAINVLTRIFGPDSQQVEQVKDIQYRTYPASMSVDRRTGRSQVHGGGSNVDKCEQRAHGLVDAFIDEIETFGLPATIKDENNEGEISITVNQNQTVSVNTVLRSMQRELSDDQAEEIRDILISEKGSDEKRKEIADKVKSFGSDVASNVVASILTNPQILGLF